MITGRKSRLNHAKKEEAAVLCAIEGIISWMCGILNELVVESNFAFCNDCFVLQITGYVHKQRAEPCHEELPHRAMVWPCHIQLS